jgi:hypothetical protein
VTLLVAGTGNVLKANVAIGLPALLATVHVSRAVLVLLAP